MPVARLEQAVLVNRKAVLTNQDRRYVYVVDENNLAERRQVTTGRQVAERTVITEGSAPVIESLLTVCKKCSSPAWK